mmetsp:Transcript_56897/g.176497  ORF Transcript_56897/g.176497 Transcript_56897/m.176497 type:complete len:91 (-) Transcript_56897:298-570(-)
MCDGVPPPGGPPLKPCTDSSGMGSCCPVEASCLADGQCGPFPSPSFLSPDWIAANPVWTWIFAILLVVLLICVVMRLLRPDPSPYASAPF